jgi:hypothetical protein
MIGLLASCENFLDRQPLSQITPDAYLNEESQLAAYAINLYPEMFSPFTTGMDAHTDIVANAGYDNRYVPGEWKTAQTGGNWSFTTIYNINPSW